MSQNEKPNILVLWGDDIGWWNISFAALLLSGKPASAIMEEYRLGSIQKASSPIK